MDEYVKRRLAFRRSMKRKEQSAGASLAAPVRIYVYPMLEHGTGVDINAAIHQRNAGWVHDPWNDHNQYAPEYALHRNVLADNVTWTSDPVEADFFLLPMYLRMGLYDTALLRRLRKTALQSLRSSPWFLAPGKHHLVVWSSQRRVDQLLGDKLFILLRPKAIFLAVEPADTRPGTLQLAPRDIVIPAYVPPSRLQSVATTQVRSRARLAYFMGSVENSAVRERLRESFGGMDGALFQNLAVVPRQDNDTTTQLAAQVSHRSNYRGNTVKSLSRGARGAAVLMLLTVGYFTILGPCTTPRSAHRSSSSPHRNALFPHHGSNV